MEINVACPQILDPWGIADISSETTSFLVKKPSLQEFLACGNNPGKGDFNITLIFNFLYNF